jgi:4-diphosphocytidyl-2-C-methyl-D-erythritol kinase
MTTAAYAKINLGLVVGSLRPDGKHEIATVLQRIALHDDVALEPADDLAVGGFDDTIVTSALSELARVAHVDPGWRVEIGKRIPVAAGLGGGSADAAAALELANATLPTPLSADRLHAVAARVGADVPFFLRHGPQLARGDGTDLEPLELPTDYTVVLVVPAGAVKESTRIVYEEFDRRGGSYDFERRSERLVRIARSVRETRDLGELPTNDLTASPLADELVAFGAFRSDVSGAGPTVYGLFSDESDARAAEEAMRARGRTYVTHPV